jgi:hypothetical protein
LRVDNSIQPHFLPQVFQIKHFIFFKQYLYGNEDALKNFFTSMLMAQFGVEKTVQLALLKTTFRKFNNFHFDCFYTFQ